MHAAGERGVSQRFEPLRRGLLDVGVETHRKDAFALIHELRELGLPDRVGGRGVLVDVHGLGAEATGTMHVEDVLRRRGEIIARVRWVRTDGREGSGAGIRARRVGPVQISGDGARTSRVSGGAMDDAPDGRLRRRRGAPLERRESRRDGRASARLSFGGLGRQACSHSGRARVTSRVVGRFERQGRLIASSGRAGDQPNAKT